MKTANIALVGVGYWGPNILRNLMLCENANVLLVCDLDKNKLKQISHLYPQLKTTTDFNEVINNKEIKSVIIATPIQTHFSLAKKVLESGKNVLIEKPMTTKSSDAKELIKIAKKNNLILMVGHTFVYTEAVQKMKEILSRKELGKLYYYDSTRINLGLFQKDANVIWDLTPHDLSILSFLIEEDPISVRTIATSHIHQGLEETAHIFIEFKNNIQAHIHVSWLSPVKIRSILIGGSEKMISYNDIEPSEKLRVYDKSVKINSSEITPFAPAYRSGKVVIPHIKQREGLLNELEHFIDCSINNKTPITDGEEGFKIVRLLEAANEAYRTNSSIKI